MAERTLIIIKPDGIGRRLTGKIISRIENKGLKIAAAKFMKIPKQLAEKHYEIHKDKYFFERTVEYLSSAPVMIMVIEGNSAVSCCRKIMGKTFGAEAEAGTIRGDFGISKTANLIHGSDSCQTAEKEIALYFNTDEICDYQMPDEQWL